MLVLVVQVEDTTFMVALGTLARLTELSVAVGPARRTTPPAILNLSHLSQLRSLQVRLPWTCALQPFQILYVH